VPLGQHDVLLNVNTITMSYHHYDHYIYLGAASDRHLPGSTLLHSALRLFDSPLAELSSPMPATSAGPAGEAASSAYGGTWIRIKEESNSMEDTEAAPSSVAEKTDFAVGRIRPPALLDNSGPPSCEAI
jgi:hypothetical protein